MNFIWLIAAKRKFRLNRHTVQAALVFSVVSVLGNFAIGRSLAEGFAAVTIMLVRTQFLFVVLMAIFFLKEKPTVSFYFGLLLILAGFISLNFRAISELSAFNTSYLWGLTAALSFASMQVYLKYQIEKIHIDETNITRLVVGAALLFMLPATADELSQLPAGSWGLVVVAGFFGPGLSRNLQLQAFRFMQASRVVLYTMMTPLLAILFEVFYQGQVITSEEIWGSIFIAAGLLLPAITELNVKWRVNR